MKPWEIHFFVRLHLQGTLFKRYPMVLCKVPVLILYRSEVHSLSRSSLIVVHFESVKKIARLHYSKLHKGVRG